jgi:hypothetical protein
VGAPSNSSSPDSFWIGRANQKVTRVFVICRKIANRPTRWRCSYRVFYGAIPAHSLSPALERRLGHSCHGPVCSTCNIHFTLLAYGTSVRPSLTPRWRVRRTVRDMGRRRAPPAVNPTRSRLFGQSRRPCVVCRSLIYGSQFASATPRCLR